MDSKHGSSGSQKMGSIPNKSEIYISPINNKGHNWQTHYENACYVQRHSWFDLQLVV